MKKTKQPPKSLICWPPLWWTHLCWILGLLTLIILEPSQTKTAAANDPASQTKTITLIEKDGTRLPIGTLTLTKNAKGHAINVTMDDSKYGEFFLNMAPFKCIEGSIMYCHLPYPYKTHKTITATDLMDLEYELLFVKKLASEYGIDFWHGVYYRLKQTPDGTFIGKVYETDMNELMAPPEKDYDRPIGGADLSEAGIGQHRFPKIEIE